MADDAGADHRALFKWQKAVLRKRDDVKGLEKCLSVCTKPFICLPIPFGIILSVSAHFMNLLCCDNDWCSYLPLLGWIGQLDCEVVECCV